MPFFEDSGHCPKVLDYTLLSEMSKNHWQFHYFLCAITNHAICKQKRERERERRERERERES